MLVLDLIGQELMQGIGHYCSVLTMRQIGKFDMCGELIPHILLCYLHSHPLICNVYTNRTAYLLVLYAKVAF